MAYKASTVSWAALTLNWTFRPVRWRRGMRLATGSGVAAGSRLRKRAASATAFTASGIGADLSGPTFGVKPLTSRSSSSEKMLAPGLDISGNLCSHFDLDQHVALEHGDDFSGEGARVGVGRLDVRNLGRVEAGQSAAEREHRTIGIPLMDLGSEHGNVLLREL